MTSLGNDDISISATSFCMMLMGFWQTANRREEYLRILALSYTMLSFIFLLSIQILNIHQSWGDLGTCLYHISNGLNIIMSLCKIFVLLPHREKLFYLIEYVKREFLYVNYNNYEASVLAGCKPNIGKNESDRELPFYIEVDLPLSMTPYFEIIFFFQVATLYPIIFGHICFDNFLCIMSLHVAGQFRILQYRISNTSVIKNMDELKDVSDKSLLKFTEDYYIIFKNYIHQHQALVAYCDQLEEVFSLLLFVQLLSFSLFICLDGFQILLANAPDRRIIFFFHLLSIICHLFMFTYSCDSVIRESRKLALAVYSGPWVFLPSNKNVQKLRRDLVMIIMRSNIPCCLTAYGFFIVSLETYSRVLSTAASYFTLVKGMQDTSSS
uniref:odorant receptor 4-like n=1 Tax=Osmia lignaria TaxID=473952 RepID=UPI00147901F1|nr:odorant receptor 4-like [Osmia lignaria]